MSKRYHTGTGISGKTSTNSARSLNNVNLLPLAKHSVAEDRPTNTGISGKTSTNSARSLNNVNLLPLAKHFAVLPLPPGKSAAMKGFVLSLSAVALVLTLVLLSAGLSNGYYEMERSVEAARPMIYAAVVTDSAGHEIGELAGPTESITANGTAVRIYLAEKLPKADFSGKLGSYIAFLQGNFSGLIHADVRVNASNMTDGKLEAYIMERYLYENNYTGNNTVLFGTMDQNGSTGATRYALTLSAASRRAYVSGFPWGSGDMNVTITYQDLNGTVRETGLLSSSQENNFTIMYGNETPQKTVITLGKAGGREGAFRIASGSLPVSFSMDAVLPPHNATMPMAFRYAAEVGYVQGAMNRTIYAIR